MPEPEDPIQTTTNTTAAARTSMTNGCAQPPSRWWSKEALTGSTLADREQLQLQPAAVMMMDLDLDLDASWPFDQIFSTSSANNVIVSTHNSNGNNPSSPFLLSDQPYSPLWAFSDDNHDDKPAGNAVTAAAASFYPRFLSYTVNQDLTTENPSVNEEKRKPPPILSLTPIDYPDDSCIIKERMSQALRYFKDSTEQHVLAQVWAPVKNGSRYVLTTSGQPFVLDPNSNGLHQYRMVSLMYKFYVDGETDEVLGLPGRVFRQKLPEWTPNVQYYSSKEFSRLDHALHYNVRGTLALPVFESTGQSCVGVLELIMTSQKINYSSEVDKVCKALEAVNLKSSEILDQPNTQICNEGRKDALVEILEILTVVCETHKLPLAQTWVPCRHRSVLAYGGGLKKSCSSFDGSCMGQVCMSTSDVAFYVVDAHMWGFREACAEHHLQKGQGVAGRAFALRSSCFCADITQFCKTEYPLVHYARMFGITSSFAICLRSTQTGDDDYILEFFLPPSITERRDQQQLLDSLLVTMKPHFRSLRVASGKELEHDWRSIEIIKSPINEKLDFKPETIPISRSAISPSVPTSLTNGEVHVDSLEDRQLVLGYNTTNGGGSIVCTAEAQNAVSVCPPETKVAGKKPERKRGKAEKTISLEVLQQYFSGSLKDAAKSLGVCPTTMKRICRQHGISRWPSRKINKVNRSLSKLKRVIESVQVTEGAFTLTSLATSSLPVAVGSISWSASLNDSNQHLSPAYKPSDFPEDKNAFYSHMNPGSNEVAEISNQVLGGGFLENEHIPQQNGFVPCEGSHRSKTRSGSREESTGTPASQASCQGSPGSGNQTSPHNDLAGSPVDEQCMKVGGSSELAFRPTGNLSAVLSTPESFVSTQPQGPFGGMLIEDAGSSHDLRNLCPGGEGLFDERLPEYSWTNPPCSDALHKDSNVSPAEGMPKFSARPEMKAITIKATYREDIIRFRFSLDTGIVKLREEVAKRLKLEQGTFDIKYLDDDHEWVLVVCDADLEECVEISRSSGNNITRLLVHDINANLGSSCESSGE